MRGRLMHALCDLEVGNRARGRAPLVMRVSFDSLLPWPRVAGESPQAGPSGDCVAPPPGSHSPLFHPSGSCGGSCTSPCPGRCDLWGVCFLSLCCFGLGALQLGVFDTARMG